MKKLIFIIILATAAACARCADKTVAELNPDFEPAMVAALKSDVPCFSLLHFSDIHSDASEFARLCEFYGTYEKYFDGAVCTGDLIEASLLSDFTYWAKTPGHEKVMIAIGNHDTLRDHKNWEPNVWDNQMTMKESYDYYMKPFIKGWNVIYEEGKTYYFKDYTAEKVRLIVIDCMLRESQDKAAENGQLAWFKQCLMGAKVKGYTVVIANHFPMMNNRGIPCNFTEDEFRGWGWYTELNRYQAAVDRFMKTGGKFACWFGGHDHCDYICYNTDYPDQIDICIAASSRQQCQWHCKMKRPDGTKAEDLANAMVVNTADETITLIRVGCDTDSDGVKRHGFVMNYKTREIIDQY